MKHFCSFFFFMFHFLLIGVSFADSPKSEPVAPAYQGLAAGTVSEEFLKFIPDGKLPIFFKEVDLNADSYPDYLMVLDEMIQLDIESSLTAPETPRTLAVITRAADGTLHLAKQNDKVVYCRACGGVFGDPFESIEFTKRGFILNMYGGSNWRWENNFEFAYSRVDKTWQLVKVKDASYHTAAPDEMESHIYKPPKDFGKIDLADFDPNHFFADVRKQNEGR